MHKILYLTILVLLIFFSTFSTSVFALPTDKGNLIVLGEISFSRYGGDYRGEGQDSYDSVIEFNFDPSINYFIKNGFALGGHFHIASYTRTGENTIDYNKSTVALGPDIKYYFHLREGQEFLFINFALLYEVRTEFYDFTSNGVDTIKYILNGTLIRTGIGFTLMITDAVGITGAINYDIETLIRKTEIDYTSEEQRNYEEEKVNYNEFKLYIGFNYFILN